MGKINTKNIIKILAIGFIVVLCPAASWYYLQKGLDYQKEARKEIIVKEHINVEDFVSRLLINDSTLLDNKLRIVFFNDNANIENSDQALIDKLVDQFEDSKGVLVLEFVKNSVDLPVSHKIVNETYIRLNINPSEYDNIISNKIGQPIFETKEGKLVIKDLQKGLAIKEDAASYAVLIDHENGLRNFYKTKDEARIKRLVEHIAILIPRVDIEKAELIREKEM